MTSRSITAALVAGGMAVLAPCPFAAAEEKKAAKAMELPKPAAEMSNLKFFDGSWSCSGEGVMEPGGAPMQMTTSVDVHSDLGGFWQSGKIKGAMPGMPPFEGMFHTTWDSGAKQYVMLWVDNMGGWSESRATGWNGDVIVYTGATNMGGAKMGSRDTFTRKADGTMVHMGEMEVGGKWTKMMEETCRKSAR
jgi:hypothetical protein